jgi:hypothetical protein
MISVRSGLKHFAKKNRPAVFSSRQSPCSNFLTHKSFNPFPGSANPLPGCGNEKLAMAIMGSSLTGLTHETYPRHLVDFRFWISFVARIPNRVASSNDRPFSLRRRRKMMIASITTAIGTALI